MDDIAKEVISRQRDVEVRRGVAGHLLHVFDNLNLCPDQPHEETSIAGRNDGWRLQTRKEHPSCHSQPL